MLFTNMKRQRPILLLGLLLLAWPLHATVNWQATSAIAARAAGGADPTVTLPAHIAGDVMLLQVVNRNVTDTLTVSGWTQLATVDRSTVARYWWYWLRAAGSSETNPLIDMSATTSDVFALVTTYRGALAAGDPWEVKGTPQVGTADPTVLTTISSLTAAALIVASVTGEDNNNGSIIGTGTNPSAYTEIYVESATGLDGVTTISYANRTTAGATGTVSINWNTAVPIGTGGLLLSLKPEPPPVGGAGRMTLLGIGP